MERIKKEKVLEKIKEFINENGYSPTVRELCVLTGRSSPATIHHHLKKLKQENLIDYIEGRNRTIRVIGQMVGDKWI